MLVEPESLCWLTGRIVAARDGATWAQEFARFPALKAVVRDDGSGLGKGLSLERARRHAAHQGGLFRQHLHEQDSAAPVGSNQVAGRVLFHVHFQQKIFRTILGAILPPGAGQRAVGCASARIDFKLAR